MTVTALQSAPKQPTVVSLLAVHVLPAFALAAVVWWYARLPIPFRHDPFLAAALIYGLQSVVSLWRITALSVGSAVTAGPWPRWNGISFRPWLFSKPEGKTIETALWLMLPAVFGIVIFRLATVNRGPEGPYDMLAGANVRHVLLLLYLGSVAQMVRVYAAALDFVESVPTGGVSVAGARTAMYGTWIVWQAMPAALWSVGMGLSWGLLPFDKPSLSSLICRCSAFLHTQYIG